MSSIPENPQQNAQRSEEELDMLRDEIQRLRRIIRALMYGYSSICEADFRTGRVRVVQLGASIFGATETADGLPLWDEMVAAYIANGVFAEDRAEVQRFFDRRTIPERLQHGGSITKEYRNQLGIYGEAKIVRIGESRVIVGFTEKDLEIKQRKNLIYADSLTHVKNRKYYDLHLVDQPCQALVIADVDHFKTVNDTYGHLCGDIALATVASVLQSSVRDEDIIVRYGGDEFVIVFRYITPESLRDRMEDIRRVVENIRLADYPQARMSMSFGVAYGDGRIEDMLPAADELLYQAKKTRNTVVIRPFSQPARAEEG